MQEKRNKNVEGEIIQSLIVVVGFCLWNVLIEVEVHWVMCQLCFLRAVVQFSQSKCSYPIFFFLGFNHFNRGLQTKKTLIEFSLLFLLRQIPVHLRSDRIRKVLASFFLKTKEYFPFLGKLRNVWIDNKMEVVTKSTKTICFFNLKNTKNLDVMLQFFSSFNVFLLIFNNSRRFKMFVASVKTSVHLNLNFFFIVPQELRTFYLVKLLKIQRIFLYNQKLTKVFLRYLQCLLHDALRIF